MLAIRSVERQSAIFLAFLQFISHLLCQGKLFAQINAGKTLKELNRVEKDLAISQAERSAKRSRCGLIARQ
jgi:hypothetical protein